jgi:hypothetical protein
LPNWRLPPYFDIVIGNYKAGKEDGKTGGIFFPVAAKAVAGRGRLFSIQRGIPMVGAWQKRTSKTGRSC